MTLRSPAAAAALLLLAACEMRPAAEPDYAPRQAGTVDHALCLLGYTGVPMRELPSGHHIVEVTLNGRPASFVLDTGANATVLHAAHAEEFGMPTRGVPGGAVGLGGPLQTMQVQVDSFAIGPVPIRIRTVTMADLGQLTVMLAPMAGHPIHGIVGQDAMAEHRAVIDVSRSIVHLIPDDQEPAPVPAERCAPRSEEAEPSG